MYDLFKGSPSRQSSAYVFPEMIYVRRVYRGLIDDVQSYYRRNPKYVDPKNAIGNILLHIHVRMDLDDRAFAAMVEDVCDPLVKAFGFTSSISKGKSFTQGVTLGEQTSEVVIAHSEAFDTSDLRLRWRKLAPLKYLYHSRTDLNLPIPNNRTPGKGYGVSCVNIPMLAVMYRYWLRFNLDKDIPQREAVYRFIGGWVLPNAIESYLDVAFFNRLARQAQGIGTPDYPTPHPFYVTDMSPRVERILTVVNQSSANRSKDIEQLAWATPVITQDNLFKIGAIPKEPVTRQNEWAVILARLPYVKYLVQQTLKVPGTDRAELNKVKIALLEAKWDNTVKTIGDPELAKIYQTQVDQLMELLA